MSDNDSTNIPDPGRHSRALDHVVNGASPFDAIRRVRPDGTAYWSARDLQITVEYSRWEDFSKIIDRAITSARNSGEDVAQSFSVITEKPLNGGRPRTDVELSRFGAYLTVMNGDPNMPRVAEAQAYFAIKTREAETRPVAELPSKRELAQWVIEAENRADEADRLRVIEQKGREAAESYAKELEPKAQYVDDFVSTDDCILFRTLANQLDMQETELRDLLVKKKRIYRQFIGRRFSKKVGRLVDEYEWRAYAEYKQHFRLFPQHNAPRHHNNQLRQTLYITPPGAQAIQKLVSAEVPA